MRMLVIVSLFVAYLLYFIWRGKPIYLRKFLEIYDRNI